MNILLSTTLFLILVRDEITGLISPNLIVHLHSSHRNAVVWSNTDTVNGNTFNSNSNDVGRVPAPAFALAALSGNGDDEVDFNVEAARKQLESLMGTSSAGTKSKRDEREEFTLDGEAPILSLDTLHRQSPPPPLSAHAKESRVTEMRLVNALAHSDDSLSEIWSHWFAEQGAGAAHELLHAEELANSGSPDDFPEAERLLRKLIAKHSVYWAEPVNRLATLLYRQGRLRESKACCEIVLAVKPWHFGALSGIVLVCAGMKDYVNAKIWADRRLPPVQPDGTTNNGRRTDWVRRAVQDAKLTLARPEAFVTGIEEDDDEDEELENINSNTDTTAEQKSDGIWRDDDEQNAWQ